MLVLLALVPSEGVGQALLVKQVLSCERAQAAKSLLAIKRSISLLSCCLEWLIGCCRCEWVADSIVVHAIRYLLVFIATCCGGVVCV
jgi:hypothetical protein